ncbi:hypothetical protein KSP39_PZI002015 [Platanthera zijinensis]|uniref:Copper amine oxidase N3-terminal domain-containing protein n=1 Tax=Platanthera zijinensis TaxID=2320716 RepID=A0AAP0BZK7_9ASPA
MEEPKQDHFTAAKRILRYVNGTRDHGQKYSSGGELKLVGYSDSDYGGDVNDRKSTSGYAFNMGTAAFSWSSKKQATIALSSCETEYIAATACACQAIWLRNLLGELHHAQEGPTTVLVDNMSAIQLAKNPVLHGRSKHIETRYYFLREQVEQKTVEEILLYFCTLADSTLAGAARTRLALAGAARTRRSSSHSPEQLALASHSSEQLALASHSPEQLALSGAAHCARPAAALEEVEISPNSSLESSRRKSSPESLAPFVSECSLKRFQHRVASAEKRRLIKLQCFAAGETANLYMRPLEGIIMVADLEEERIVDRVQ